MRGSGEIRGGFGSGNINFGEQCAFGMSVFIACYMHDIDLVGC